jgi:hypothetical protein
MMHKIQSSIALIFLATVMQNVPAEEPLALKIIVKLRDNLNDKQGKPFVDVGGFTVKRNNAELKNATCPNPSNKKGELICKLQCELTDADLRVMIVSPAKERARIVAGLTAPISRSLDITGCKIETPLPVEMVFRTPEVVLADLSASNPDVYRAISDDNDLHVGFITLKPFSVSSGRLKELAKDEKNRDALLEVASLANAYSDLSPEKRPAALVGGKFHEYATGLNSIVFQALVNDSAGAAIAGKVKISPSATDFHYSVGAVEKELNTKQFLSEKEIRLSNTMHLIKIDPKATNEKLQLMREYVAK